MHIDTILAQLDHFIDTASAGIVPPFQPSTTYVRNPDNSPVQEGRVYGRDQNPTFEIVEKVLALIEGGDAAQIFPSGQAAGMVLLQALKPGDHVIAGRHMYWALRGQIESFCVQWRLKLTLVDIHSLTAIKLALRPDTKLVLAEAPTNPMMIMPDIKGISTLLTGTSAVLAVDATAATPILLRPLTLGADFVFHSTTKALNGHSDLLGGVLVAKSAFSQEWQAISKLRAVLGNVPSAFDAWLLARGLRTAALRVRAASKTALAVAQFLEASPHVSEVLYPGLASSSSHAIAKRDMTDGFGMLLSFRLKAGSDGALAVLSQLKLFLRATSLGGTESLVEYRAPIEGPTSPVPDNLLRLSIGIEHQQDIIDDLEQALASLGGQASSVSQHG